MSFDYQKYQNDLLKNAGFNLNALTEEQKSLILQPLEAPENYMCDGEISGKVAFKIWINKLKELGLNSAIINQAIRFNFN